METARGTEYGRVVVPNKEVDDSEIVQPLKPVLRKATPKDDEQLKKNLQKREEALRIAAEKSPDAGFR